MKLEHIAVASNSEQDSDRFFIELLGLKKTRSFLVSPDLIEQFFGVEREQKIVRYEKESLSTEVFITEDDSNAKDVFTHSCLIVESPEKLINEANTLGFTTIKVPRKDGSGYYYFIKDMFGNLYEIKG